MAIFLENSISYTVGGEGVYSGNYSYADINITAKPSGQVDWKISMRCPANGSGKIPLTRIEFYIDGQKIYNTYFDNYGSGFPCKNGSTASGYIMLKDPNDTSVSITFNLGVNYRDKCQYTSSKTLSRSSYTKGSAPSLLLSDTGTNSVKISGVFGKNGTNNPLTETALYFTLDGTDPKTSSTRREIIYTPSVMSGANYSFTAAITKACTVKAYVVANYKYNNTSATGSSTAKYYVKPSNPGKPTIYYTKSKLTPKERIIYNWTAASAGNSNSPVIGYRVRLYKNGVNIPVWSTTSGSQLSKLNSSSGTDWIYDREVSTPLNISLGPEIHGFKVGDKVKLSIQAYSRFGTDNTGDNSALLSSVITSAETVIQESSSIGIKINGSWEEGQPFIKVAGRWLEAESVNIKTGGSWKESV